MVRRITANAVRSPPCCWPRRSAPLEAQDAASKALKWDPATKTVTFELIAGAHGAKSPFNFNGYIDGDANLIVPPASERRDELLPGTARRTARR